VTMPREPLWSILNYFTYVIPKLARELLESLQLLNTMKKTRMCFVIAYIQPREIGHNIDINIVMQERRHLIGLVFCGWSCTSKPKYIDNPDA
jgi:hypothetical protein